MADRAGLLGQDQEGCLEGILRVVVVTEYGPADAQDHRPVPLHQSSEGCLVALVEVALEEVGVRQPDLAAGGQAIEEAQEGGGAGTGHIFVLGVGTPHISATP